MASHLIRAKRIETATGDPQITNGHVLVVDNRIESVGAGTPDAPPGTSVIDADAGTVVPGLIDCHTHVAGMHQDRPQEITEAQRLAADSLDVAIGLRGVLRSGITTIRDCGYPHHGIHAIRNAVRAGRLSAPRMFLAGRAICASGGHGASISVEVDGVDEVRRAVRIESRAGADWIKLMVTGGTATPGEAVTDVQLTADEVAAAVDEAHRRGKLVAAHCSNLEGTRIAIEAGVDSVEHGIALDEDLVNRMVQSGIWLGTTLRCTQIEGTAGPESGIPGYIREKAAPIYQQQMASFKLAFEAGVRIAAATDAAQPYLALAGSSLVDELLVMTELGMPPHGALLAATKDAACLLRVNHDLGTLESGKLADLMIVDGDPASDPSVLAHPTFVMADGRIV